MDSLDFGSTPDLKKMGAETVDDLVASRKPAAKEIDGGEDELEDLLREAGLDVDDEIEVIDPKTGRKEYISKGDPSYYESSGFKGRRYKGSSKPKDVPLGEGRGRRTLENVKNTCKLLQK